MPAASSSTAGGPSTGTAAAADAAESSALDPATLKRQLLAAKVDLQEAIKQKRTVDRNLATIEHTLYQFESNYLAPPQDGAPVGNVVKGYDNYLKALTSTNLGPYDRKRTRIGFDVRDDERLFSRSSETYLRSLELKERDLSATSDDEPKTKRKRA